jgi:hypothetical protein
MQLDTPNLTIPLVPSYNERGVNGYTATVTNSLDQRRINTLYEMVHNPVTGKLTPYIVKRPGLTDYGVTVGAASDVQYLNVALLGNGTSWTASLNGTTTKVWDGSTNTSVVTAASLYPQFIDKTLISGVETVVLSLMDTSGSFDQRTFYASAIGAWTEITDVDYTGYRLVGKPEQLDGFMFQLTGDNYVINSDSNSLANWTATNYEPHRQANPARRACWACEVREYHSGFRQRLGRVFPQRWQQKRQSVGHDTADGRRSRPWCVHTKRVYNRFASLLCDAR